jgi:hypothetical protein
LNILVKTINSILLSSTKIIKKFFIDSLNNYLDLDKDFNIQLSDIDFAVIRK